MIRQSENKTWTNRSQQTTGHVTIIFPERHQHRRMRMHHHHHPVQMKSMQHVQVNARPPEKSEREITVYDKEREASVAKWVLNVIAAHEAYQQGLKMKKANSQPSSIGRIKQSFQSRKSSRVEPIEPSSQFQQTPIQNSFNIPLTPTTIDDCATVSLSSFSTATSFYDVETRGKTTISSRIRLHNQSDDYATDEFKNSGDLLCMSRRMIILLCSILSIILIVGIILAVVLTIFVGKNPSMTSNTKSLTVESAVICPTVMFNITDELCQGKIPYNYYSCYQMATTTAFTIRFSLQHDASHGHWYFDDISAVQNNNIQLIVNGGFESNLTGWILNISTNSSVETYVDTTSGLAHTGSAYLYGASKTHPDYIEQTFNVIQGEYINISFWWGYDGGLKLENICQAIGQLLPSL